MRFYTAYLDDRGPVPEFVLIKEGFCWPGFFLSAFWALWHRLWLVALGLLGVSVGLSMIVFMLGVTPLVQGMVSLGFAVAVGFVANDLRRWTLERHGYVFKAIVSGRNLEAAELRFLDETPELASRMAVL